jgi:hypothetical protein
MSGTMYEAEAAQTDGLAGSANAMPQVLQASHLTHARAGRIEERHNIGTPTSDIYKAGINFHMLKAASAGLWLSRLWISALPQVARSPLASSTNGERHTDWLNSWV